MIHPTKLIDPQSLGLLKITRPKKSSPLWQGIAHIRLLEAIQTGLKQLKWKVSRPTIGLSKDGADITACWDCSSNDDPTSFQIGVLSSNARRHSLQLYLGREHHPLLEVFAGRKRSHSTFNLEGAINDALTVIGLQLEQTRQLSSKLDNACLTRAQADVIALKAAKERILPFSRLRVVTGFITGTFASTKILTSESMLHALCVGINSSPVCSQLKLKMKALKLIQSAIDKQ